MHMLTETEAEALAAMLETMIGTFGMLELSRSMRGQGFSPVECQTAIEAVFNTAKASVLTELEEWIGEDDDADESEDE